MVWRMLLFPLVIQTAAARGAQNETAAMMLVPGRGEPSSPISIFF